MYGRKTYSRFAKAKPRFTARRAVSARRTVRRSTFRRKFKSHRKFSRRKTGLRRIASSRMKDTYQSDRVFCKLKFVEPPFIASATTGVLQTESYRMNNLFDPYSGAGGGQPSGYATMFAQYSTCVVHAAKFTVTITNIENSNDNGSEWVLVPYASSGTIATNIATALEQPYAKGRTIGSAKGGVSQIKLSQFMTIKKIQGNRALHTDDYEQESGSGPVLQPFWTYYGLIPTGSSVAGSNTFNFEVKMTFYCEFYGRLNTPPAIVDTLIKEAKLSGHWDELIHKDDMPTESLKRIKPKFVVVPPDEPEYETKMPVPETPRKTIPVKKSTR